MLRYNPWHVSSITMLIFRRSIVLLQHLVSSLSVNGCTVTCSQQAYSRLRRVSIHDAVIIQLTSWRLAWWCSKHVEDYNVTYIYIYSYRKKELCIKLVIETSLYYDSRSEKLQYTVQHDTDFILCLQCWNIHKPVIYLDTLRIRNW